MSSFLNDVRKASESRYMANKDHELLEKLRETMEQEASAAALSDLGIEDNAVIQALVAHGIRLETLPILHLVPLFQVAWSDGEIQTEELELLEAAAKEAKIEPNSKAYEIFRSMLAAPPDNELYEAALTYIHIILSTMPEAEADTKRTNLESLADSVAHASGKLLGLFGGVQVEERDVLKKIAGHLQNKA